MSVVELSGRTAAIPWIPVRRFRQPLPTPASSAAAAESLGGSGIVLIFPDPADTVSEQDAVSKQVNYCRDLAGFLLWPLAGRAPASIPASRAGGLQSIECMALSSPKICTPRCTVYFTSSTFTPSCAAALPTYPTAPGLCATKSTIAASESTVFGIDACPEKTRLRQLATKAPSDFPI